VKRYKFYSKQDTLKEAINSVHAVSKEDAIAYFANVKGIIVDDFVKIFSVDEH
jgi:hypothetical protein